MIEILVFIGISMLLYWFGGILLDHPKALQLWESLVVREEE